MCESAGHDALVQGLRAELERLRGRLSTIEDEVARREHELQRRLRNVLSLMRSIVHRTSEEAESVEEYCILLDGRISAFARVQSLLLSDPEAGIDLFGMFTDEVLAAGLPPDAIVCEGEGVRVSARAANLIALLAHELVLSASRRPVEPDGSPIVHVRHRIARQGDKAVVYLDWAQRWPDPDLGNDGVPVRWLRDALAYELNGELRTSHEGNGSCLRLVFPADESVLLEPQGVPQPGR